MTHNTAELTCLETLPTEILHAVVGFLRPWQIKQLSCTSKRLRQACLSILFRKVRFDFSRAGIERLKAFLKSNALCHVASFTYTVTQVFKSGILDYNGFRSDNQKPDDHLDAAKEQSNAGYDSNDTPSYMAVSKTRRDIYEEQRSIVNDGADHILSSIFYVLPLLSEVKLCFGEALVGEDCLLSSEGLFEDQFYLHHFQVVTSAIQIAHMRGIAIDTVSLWGFNLPHFHSWEQPDLAILSGSLRLLLDGVKTLRLRGSECVLELLSHCTLQLHQLDMCELTTTDITLMDFLQTRKPSDPLASTK